MILTLSTGWSPDILGDGFANVQHSPTSQFNSAVTQLVDAYQLSKKW